MQFRQFYSGSKGNLYTLTAQNGHRLIIDPGVTWKKLQNALAYDLTNIAGCLVSHEHKDHSKAVRDIMQAGIDVYASDGTLKALEPHGKKHRKSKILTTGWVRTIWNFTVRTFESNHDAIDPVFFVIGCDDEYMLFATDTSHIKQRFNIPFSIIAVECSYDKDILQDRVESGDINETLAKRLLTSHMEKQVAMKYLAEYCDLSRCSAIHLLHLSDENIDKEQAKKDFEKRFFIETKVI